MSQQPMWDELYVSTTLLGRGPVKSTLPLRVAWGYISLDNVREMPGLAAVQGSGPGSHSHYRSFSLLRLCFLPAVGTTQAVYLLAVLWKSKGVTIWSSARCGWWDAPTMVKSGEQPGRHRKGDLYKALIHSSPWLEVWAIQPYVESLLFKTAASSFLFIIFSSHFPLCFPIWNEQKFIFSTGLLGGSQFFPGMFCVGWEGWGG